MKTAEQLAQETLQTKFYSAHQSNCWMNDERLINKLFLMLKGIWPTFPLTSSKQVLTEQQARMTRSIWQDALNDANVDPSLIPTVKQYILSGDYLEWNGAISIQDFLKLCAIAKTEHAVGINIHQAIEFFKDGQRTSIEQINDRKTLGLWNVQIRLDSLKMRLSTNEAERIQIIKEAFNAVLTQVRAGYPLKQPHKHLVHNSPEQDESIDEFPEQTLESLFESTRKLLG